MARVRLLANHSIAFQRRHASCGLVPLDESRLELAATDVSEPSRIIPAATCGASRRSRMLPDHARHLLMAIVEASVPAQYPALPGGGGRLSMWSFCESSPPEPPRPRLLDRVRQSLRAGHLSRGTEEAHVAPGSAASSCSTTNATPPNWGRRRSRSSSRRDRLDPEPTAGCPPVPVQGRAGDRLPWLDGIVRGQEPGGCSACDSASGLGEYMQRDMRRDVAASHDQRRSFHADASSWSETPRCRCHKVDSRSVYPAILRRGCGITQISLSSGRIVVRRRAVLGGENTWTAPLSITC